MILMLPLVAIRMLMYAILMRARRTILVTYGTVVRVLSLFPALYICDALMDGAVVGATAIIVCIALEMLYALVAAWPFYRRLPATSGVRAEYKEVWIFAWPVMIMHTAEHGVSFLVSLFLGRLPNPRDGFSRIRRGRQRVEGAAKPATQSDCDGTISCPRTYRLRSACEILPPDRRSIRHRTRAVLCAGHQRLDFDGSHGPERRTRRLRRLCTCRFGVVGVEHNAAAAARGFLISSAETRILALSSAIRLIAVALVGTTAVHLGAGNGAAVGLWALTAAFATEAAVLLYRVRNMRKAGTLRPS